MFGHGRVNLSQAVRSSLQCLLEIVLAGEIHTIGQPYRQAVRAEFFPDPDDFDIVRYRLLPDLRVAMAKGSVPVAVRLPGLVLEGVGIHRVKKESVGCRPIPDGLEILRNVPGNVQRNGRPTRR